MLPKEIDAALGSLGTDGERVRGVIEREFASYLEATEPARRSRNLGGAFTIVSVAFLRPLVLRYSKHLADQIFSTDAKEYDDRLQAVRARLGIEIEDRAGRRGPGSGLTAGRRGRGRTDTPLTRHRLLRPARLPFRHSPVRRV